MAAKEKAKNPLTRNAALDGRPHPMPVTRREEQDDGSLKIVVRLTRSRWQKWFGAPPEFDRTMWLDVLGREVYEACDGKRLVIDIVKGFADKHTVSIAESERAVTTYLKTLMGKGLIGMKLERLS